jgi:hypothetical protein
MDHDDFLVENIEETEDTQEILDIIQHEITNYVSTYEYIFTHLGLKDMRMFGEEIDFSHMRVLNILVNTRADGVIFDLMVSWKTILRLKEVDGKFELIKKMKNNLECIDGRCPDDGGIFYWKCHSE